MKLVIQRVKKASVSVEGKVLSEIGKGYLVLVGVGMMDTEKQVEVVVGQLAKLRVMSDDGGRMNLSVKDACGEMLVVSQFTLYGEMKGGNRPSFVTAARPDRAEPLYEYFVERLRGLGVSVKTGRFGADMEIAADLDGPVTILMEG